MGGLGPGDEGAPCLAPGAADDGGSHAVCASSGPSFGPWMSSSLRDGWIAGVLLCLDRTFWSVEPSPGRTESALVGLGQTAVRPVGEMQRLGAVCGHVDAENSGSCPNHGVSQLTCGMVARLLPLCPAIRKLRTENSGAGLPTVAEFRDGGRADRAVVDGGGPPVLAALACVDLKSTARGSRRASWGFQEGKRCRRGT